MSDLISRQAAIDALLHHGELENDYTDLYHDGYCDGIYDSCDVLEDLPSAQPEPCADAVSRPLAIGAAIESVDEWDGGYNVQRANMIRDAIKNLPSAQPEIIRCKECKYYTPKTHRCEPLGLITCDGFWCKQAERIKE